jgi:hypothetical protein
MFDFFPGKSIVEDGFLKEGWEENAKAQSKPLIPSKNCHGAPRRR